MSIFLNSPWPIVCIGLVAEAVLGLILIRTGRGVLLWAMGGVLAVVGLGVLVQWAVVTDEELIGAAIDGCAESLEKGDLNRLLGYISPAAEDTRSDARHALRLLEFIHIKVNALEITVDRRASPRTAIAKFTALVTGRDRKGEYTALTEPIPFQVDFRLEGDRWLISGYKLDRAHGGFREAHG